MELEQIVALGLNNIDSLSVVKKEFRNSVDEPWKDADPYPRYQKKLLEDLAVLDDQKEDAITLLQYEKLTGEERLYSIRHPNTKKNVRVLYTIVNGTYIILLHAFLEKSSNDYKKQLQSPRNDLSG